MSDPPGPQAAETPHGTMQYLDIGAGEPVLFVHGSPGGCDQAELMTRFLVADGFRVIAPSRPGYLDTPLRASNATPDAQAEMGLSLMDTLEIEAFGLMCWSGGGPSAYRLAAEHPSRVTALATIAAVSRAYTFAGGAEASLMAGRFGRWLIDEMAKHSPKALIRSTVNEEGDLSKDQLKDLTDEIWDDQNKRDFVLALAGTVAGRKAGLDNDHQQFPQLGDLGLGSITAPTLLIHGTADTDVDPDHSDFALGQIPGADILRIEGGTHIAAWTDPTGDAVQQRIGDHLRPRGRA